MANRLFKQFQGTLEAGVVKLYGSVTTSTSGTVGSSTGKGLTVTKTSAKTGRYTVTLADKYTALLNVTVSVVGSTNNAYTAAKGVVWTLRNVNVAASTPYLEVQFIDPATSADAELQDGASFYVAVTLKNTSAY